MMTTYRALDAGPVLRLIAFASLMTLGIAVAATKDTLLRAVTRHVALLLAVMASTATTAAAASSVGRLGTVGLVVTVKVLAC